MYIKEGRASEYRKRLDGARRYFYHGKLYTQADEKPSRQRGRSSTDDRSESNVFRPVFRLLMPSDTPKCLLHPVVAQQKSK